MTADFDPQEIARRVAERERARLSTGQLRPGELVDASLIPKQPGLVSRTEGVRTGCGSDQTHLDLPVRNPRPADLFDRLAEAEERRRIQSPFATLPPLPKDDRSGSDKRGEPYRNVHDPDRFTTPDLDEDTEMETPQISIAGRPRAERVGEHQPRASTHPVVVDEPRGPSLSPAGSGAPHQLSGPSSDCNNDGCGLLLTGGGAPRGWVLIRIIGGGPPRRYCSPRCASKAILSTTTVNAVSRPAQPPRTPERRRGLVDEHLPEIIRRYQAGQAPPEIGTALGHTAGTVRGALDRAGIQRRDDRKSRSGSTEKAYPPQLVDQVRALYIGHGKSQNETAAALGLTHKIVQNIMARHEIPAREPGKQHKPGQDGAAGLKALMADNGLTTAQVRAWAAKNGIRCGIRGLPPRTVVDAFLAAHRHGARVAS